MDEQMVKYQRMIEETDKRMKGLIAKWVLRYDYFGFLFSLVRRVAKVDLPYIAAVAPTEDSKLELQFNPILVAATKDEYIHRVLHHEGLHILNKHISRMMRLLADIPERDIQKYINIINIAADCCVNEQGKILSPLMIAGTPFNLHYPKDFDLPAEKMMEQYFYILLDRMRKNEQNNSQSNQSSGSDQSEDDKEGQNQQQSGQQDSDDTRDENASSSGEGGEEADGESGGSGGKEKQQDGSQGEGDSKSCGQARKETKGHGGADNSDLGNHKSWNTDGKLDPYTESRHIDSYSRRIIRESAKNFQRNTKARGNLPGYLQELIENALKPAPVPYYEIIRQLVRGSRLGKYKRSSAHVNRKRMYVFQMGDINVPIISPFPGRKRDMTFKIGIIIDTSGSQSPEDILEGLSGCKNIIEKDRDCDTTVLEVDAKIHKEYKLKRVSDIDFDVQGRMGTTLLPGLNRCRELKVDVCMCFTDGYTEDFNSIDRRFFPKRMIWVITPKGSEEKVNKTGFVIRLPERNDV